MFGEEVVGGCFLFVVIDEGDDVEEVGEVECDDDLVESGEFCYEEFWLIVKW